jgi:hypothetical protein
MLTIKDVMSPKPVATEDHNNDGLFDAITEEPMQKQTRRCPLLQSDPEPPPPLIQSLQRLFVVVYVEVVPLSWLLYASRVLSY